MIEYMKTAVIDLDGTLAEYDEWVGPDHFGKPILYAKDALLELKEWGWRIIIFTTRGDVVLVEKWLKEHGFPFNAINSCEHNPDGCSQKPIAEVYFDDRDCHVLGEKPYNWVKAMRRVRKLYQPSPLNTYIDDAAIWASFANRFFNIIKTFKLKSR